MLEPLEFCPVCQVYRLKSFGTDILICSGLSAAEGSSCRFSVSLGLLLLEQVEKLRKGAVDLCETRRAEGSIEPYRTKDNRNDQRLRSTGVHGTASIIFRLGFVPASRVIGHEESMSV